ncbi:MAG: Gfo/Idh/MocA family oxidoreductase [Propionibacteriaceae bacterium]|jgi:predicted dehydrogenase|nr:Gfo/Idh/MocA family oxidoreductase [Propionibacteriaceae bacterium]
MTDTINIGIIGCGRIAQVRHIPEYAANPNAKLVGFFDRDAARAAECAAPYDGKTYHSWAELLADPAIDAVSICVANVSHAEIAIAALQAGKHVLLEKPMATTLADCEAVVAAADASGKLLMLGHNQRFAKAHELARKLLHEGAIGKLVTFRTTFGHGGPETWSVDPGPNTWFFNPQMTTMGAVGDLGIHKTDLLHFLTGARVVEAKATLASNDKVDAQGNPIAVDDNAIALYTLSNGAIGTMMASWSFHGIEDNTTILYGQQGIIEIYTNPDYQVQVIRPGQPMERYSVEAIQTNDNQTASGVIDAFISAVLTGGPSPVSGAEALAAMRAVFACMESSRMGGTVAIPENRP